MEVGQGRTARLLEMMDGLPGIIGSASPVIGTGGIDEAKDPMGALVLRIPRERFPSGRDRLLAPVVARVERRQLREDLAGVLIDL